MKHNQVLEIINTLVYGYYTERNIDEVLACVTDDIVWIGIEDNDSAVGKEDLEKLLRREVKKYPEKSQVIINEPVVRCHGEDYVCVMVDGKYIGIPGKTSDMTLRAAINLVRKQEKWLICQLHVSVPSTDLENRKLTDKLDSEKRKQEVLINSIPGGVAIYRFKKNGKVTTDYVSDGLGKMCGYTAEEFLEYLRDDAKINVLPQDLKALMREVGNSVESLEPISVEYRVYNKAKEPVWIRLDANVFSQEDIDNDDIAIIYAVHTKISDDAAKVLEEQKRYREILDNLDLAYFEWSDADGFYASEKYSEYAMSDKGYFTILGGAGNWDTVYEEDKPKLKEFFQIKEKHLPKVATTIRLKMRNGEYKWTEMMGFFQFDSKGNPIKTIGVLRDVDKAWETQNRKLQRALDIAEKANHAKTDFLSTISHDMRTPLNGILGLTTLVKEKVTDKELMDDLIQIESSSKYLLNLINDTLDVNKIESGKLQLNPVVCDGKTTEKNIFSLLTTIINEKNIDFRFHIGKLPYTMLYIDVVRVEQVFMNIISNAIKFSPDGGIIDLYLDNVSADKGVIVDKIVIKDNGIGMKKEFLEHIFEPFRQENQDTKTRYQGTGLGLTITKQIINLMGGEITIDSELGKGTTVSFTLPMPIATKNQIENANISTKNVKHKINLEGEKILLFEDHPVNTAIATRMLENSGAIVTHAENGKIGVEIFENSKAKDFDVILMDIRMPVMDGYEATMCIRKSDHPQARIIPIIAMTANAFASDVEKSLKAGINAHLSKPIDQRRMLETISKEIQREKK